MKLRETRQGTVSNIYVKPNSKQFKIQFQEEELIAYCREAPTKGKVNKELIKELSRLFKRRVQIISGFASRQKKILIDDITIKEVKDFFRNNKKRSYHK